MCSFSFLMTHRRNLSSPSVSQRHPDTAGRVYSHNVELLHLNISQTEVSTESAVLSFSDVVDEDFEGKV